jgi:hypothetical protein
LVRDDTHLDGGAFLSMKTEDEEEKRFVLLSGEQAQGMYDENGGCRLRARFRVSEFGSLVHVVEFRWLVAVGRVGRLVWDVEAFHTMGAMVRVEDRRSFKDRHSSQEDTARPRD